MKAIIQLTNAAFTAPTASVISNTNFAIPTQQGIITDDITGA
jgi:hypothetical protein